MDIFRKVSTARAVLMVPKRATIKSLHPANLHRKGKLTLLALRSTVTVLPIVGTRHQATRGINKYIAIVLGTKTMTRG